MRAAAPILACLAVVWSASALPVRADDQPFLTVYTTDIDSEGEREAEQWFGWKTGETGASYNEFLSRTEFEYGLTDNLQGSLYLNYSWARLRLHAPPFSSRTDSVTGVSGELIWRFLNDDFDPLGLALYLEPTWSSDEREIESKILLQKNFLNDRLRCVFNVNFEDDWSRQNNRWLPGGALEFDTGVTYAVNPNVSAGLEFDNERSFEGLILGGAAREQASAFYLGPTINYETLPWKITLGAQAQLPFSYAPSGNPGMVIGGFETSAERFRAALRISRDF